LLGYARVSKGDEQNNALQTKALKAAGCRRLFEETASGERQQSAVRGLAMSGQMINVKVM
jgi:DNA invertase Pin-like site-specific DNA recombinase